MIEPVHAVPALVAVESGILGLLAVGWVFWESMMSMARSVGTRRYPMAFVWAAGWFVLLVLSFFDHYLWTFHSGLLLWPVVGAGWLLVQES